MSRGKLLIKVRSPTTDNLTNAKKQKKAPKKQKRSYYIPLTKNDRLEGLTNQAFSVIYDPPGDGSCRFQTFAYFLGAFGYSCDATLFRNQLVHYLENHSANIEGQPYELFAAIPWDQYLIEMSQDETFGDQITLQAIADLYSVHIGIVSTLGPQGSVDINEENGTQTLILGHFAEGQGDYHICLRQNTNLDDSMVDFNLYKKPVMISKILIEKALNKVREQTLNKVTKNILNKMAQKILTI